MIGFMLAITTIRHFTDRIPFSATNKMKIFEKFANRSKINLHISYVSALEQGDILLSLKCVRCSSSSIFF